MTSISTVRPSPTKDLFFLPLGGSGEIGMNLNLYCYDDQWLMVDLGVSFSRDLGIDVIMPDPAYIVERRDRLKGLVITHAHEDHIGAIPYLWERLQCPIYATPFTATLIRDKLKRVDLLGSAKVHDIPVGSRFSLNPFDLQFITLTHSIPEPNALAIRTPAGLVVHTGDWKIDPQPLVGAVTDEQAFRDLGDEGVLALVCDSTNVFVEENAGSEQTVRENLIKFVKMQTEGRIAIACFASNVARLESCAIAAREAGRQPVLVGRSMVRMNLAARANGYLQDLPPFLQEEDLDTVSREDSLIICTGSQGEPRSALARIAQGSHPLLKLGAGDTVLFSSRVIPGNEEAIYGLQENLTERGVVVIDAEKIDGIHVSGHPGRADLQEMYRWVRPHILVPVHGRLAHIQEHARLGQDCGIPQTMETRNGDLIRLSAHKLEVVDTVHTGCLALDGRCVVPLASDQMRDRARLMTSGVIFVTISLDKRGHLQRTPDVTTLGVFEKALETEMREVLQDDITEAIAQFSSDGRQNDEGLKEAIRLSCRRRINTLRGKKPVIVVHRI